MDFRRKAQLIAGRHVTNSPNKDSYSSMASQGSICLDFLLASLNYLHLLLVDIGNAHVNVNCPEKVYSLAGPKFGKHEGKVVLITKALYGLKSSSAAWHLHLAQSHRLMGFVLSKADPDMWFCKVQRPDKTECYEYIISYIDNLTIVSDKTKAISKALENIPYTLKGGSAPKIFLKVITGVHTCNNGTNPLYMSARQYLTNATHNIKQTLGET